MYSLFLDLNILLFILGRQGLTSPLFLKSTIAKKKKKKKDSMERKPLNKELCDNGDTSLIFLVLPQTFKIRTATSLLMLTSLF